MTDNRTRERGGAVKQLLILPREASTAVLRECGYEPKDKNMKRMQHCFWCGEQLGVYDSYPGDIEHCHNSECARQAQYAMREREADAREQAERDNYDRYR